MNEKNYTNLASSKKLKDLGIDQEGADVYWVECQGGIKGRGAHEGWKRMLVTESEIDSMFCERNYKFRYKAAAFTASEVGIIMYQDGDGGHAGNLVWLNPDYEFNSRLSDWDDVGGMDKMDVKAANTRLAEWRG